MHNKNWSVKHTQNCLSFVPIVLLDKTLFWFILLTKMLTKTFIVLLLLFFKLKFPRSKRILWEWIHWVKKKNGPDSKVLKALWHLLSLNLWIWPAHLLSSFELPFLLTGPFLLLPEVAEKAIFLTFSCTALCFLPRLTCSIVAELTNRLEVQAVGACHASSRLAN